MTEMRELAIKCFNAKNKQIAKANRTWYKIKKKIHKAAAQGYDGYNVDHWPWTSDAYYKQIRKLAEAEGFTVYLYTTDTGRPDHIAISGWHDYKLEPNDLLKNLL